MKSLEESWRTNDSGRIRRARTETVCYNCQKSIPQGDYFVWHRERVIADDSKVHYKIVPICIQCFAELPPKIKGG